MFYANAVGKRLLKMDEHTESYSKIILAGAFSQLLLVPCLVAPLERVKVLMQCDGKFSGQLDCLRHLVRSHGYRSLFKGTLLTYSRDVPSFTTYFLSYEYLR